MNVTSLWSKKFDTFAWAIFYSFSNSVKKNRIFCYFFFSLSLDDGLVIAARWPSCCNVSDRTDFFNSRACYIENSSIDLLSVFTAKIVYCNYNINWNRTMFSRVPASFTALLVAVYCCALISANPLQSGRFMFDHLFWQVILYNKFKYETE